MLSHRTVLEGVMYTRFGDVHHRNDFAKFEKDNAVIAQSGQLDALVMLEGIGTRLKFGRNDEIYREGDGAECWYKVISGTVRICKLLADGRRHVGEFCFSGDCFGLDDVGERLYSAEAVNDIVVLRVEREATERLLDRYPVLSRLLRETMLRDLANAHGRILLLGRMTASERVAVFLLDMFERRDHAKVLDLPMSRNDIADYLGLTIETVCRILSALKRNGVISIPNSHRIELIDREALAVLAEA
jgi:CRP/FNR family nitrogen fixation transcriptional regulator